VEPGISQLHWFLTAICTTHYSTCAGAKILMNAFSLFRRSPRVLGLASSRVERTLST
jgi:hypothetical protein